jgi:acyl-CoA synthetase (AMP-forming)/AMP-acid ligase II
MDFTMKGPGAADPALLLRTIRECGVTSMFASPALLSNLAAYAERNDIHDVGLRRIVAGGAEVPGPLFAQVRRMLAPGGEMYSDYGATEALPVAEIAGADVVEETWPLTERGAGVCVGHPLPGVEVRIIRTDDASIATWADAIELAPGEIGEVVARSPHISPRYFEQPAADAENKIVDGDTTWHRLGDTGYLDREGRLWVCGRRSHRVVTARGTAYPLCCEPVANKHPGVRRSALVRAEGPDGTVRAALCLDLEAGMRNDAAVRSQVRALLDRHATSALVDEVHVVERIPVDRRHNAKIDRPAVAAALAETASDARRA